MLRIACLGAHVRKEADVVKVIPSRVDVGLVGEYVEAYGCELAISLAISALRSVRDLHDRPLARVSSRLRR